MGAAVGNYRPRQAQTEMAKAIADAIGAQQTLIAEAGTGTGKTFAYLVPALLWGGKVIVSTGTKNLQDQLYLRDIPTVRQALKAPVSVALLKGRANYVCHFHLERTLQNGRLTSREDVGYLREISRFIKTTSTGDKAELSQVPESAPVWNLVTSTRDTCFGAECQYYQDCFVMKARKEAQQADVVVVNHHLFFADVALKDTGVAELLPSANTVIFDEAHQLPDTATLFFGDTVSTSQVLELCRDVLAEGLSHARDGADWAKVVTPVERAARDLRLAFPQDVVRLAVHQIASSSVFFQHAGKPEDRAGKPAGGAGKPGRARRNHRAMPHPRHRAGGAAGRLEQSGRRQVRRGRGGGGARAMGRGVFLLAAIAPDAAFDRADFQQAARRHAAHLDFHFRHAGGEKRFQPLHRADGADDEPAQTWPSPFDYERQGLLYVPHSLPAAEFAGLHRRRDRRRAAGDRGGRRPHLPAVHHDARGQPRGASACATNSPSANGRSR